MGWFFAILVALGAAGAWWWDHRRFTRNWRQLSEILEDLIAGREPRSFVFGAGRGFARLSDQLEKLAGEQDRLRRRRSRAEANVEAILASMGEGVLVVDQEHVIRQTNPSVLRILGLKVQPLGRTVLHALRHVDFEEIVTSVLATGQPQHAEVTLEAVKPVRHISVAATQMRDLSGKAAVVMMVHDVTRLKQLEDVRREFVANVSHELRTPLAIFQGYLENLLDNPGMPRPELVEVLGVLQRHSGRLNLLVEDLLILARLESRSDALKLEPIVAADFLRQLASDWKLRSRKKNIAITVEVEPELSTFWADPARMEQVLNNLVDNAVKYSERSGRVVLGAQRADAEIVLSVEDDGLGIAPSDLPHVFERFYRVDKARSREQGGTGLGLSIVKHIMQLHGGSVEAKSTYGQGTRIVLRLPLRSDGLQTQPGAQTQQPVDSHEHESEARLA